MLRDYADIIDRLGEPQWWDDNGCPRYCDFHPDHCGVYDDHIALLEVACQECARSFRVAVAWDRTSAMMGAAMRGEKEVPRPSLPQPGATDRSPWEAAGSFNFGDPPCHGDDGRGNDCAAGATMSAVPVRVLEFWRRGADTGHAWVRVPACEGALPPIGRYLGMPDAEPG